MVTSAPRTENAPILALGATRALGSTTAVGWMPSGAVIGRSRRARLRPRDPETRLELLEPALGRAKAAGHVGQVLLGGEEALGLEHRQGGGAEPAVAGGHVLVDARLRAEHRAVADREVVRKADLTSGDDAAAEPARAGDADLCHDDRVLADLDVVADLHEVVDLRAAADDGPAQHGAVDRGVGADVHVVFDHDDADLRDLAMRGAVEDVAESVAADDGAGLDRHAAAEPDALAQHHPRMGHRGFAYLDSGSDIGHRVDTGPGPDDRARVDHRQSAHRGARVHAGVARHDRRRIDAGRWRRRRVD